MKIPANLKAAAKRRLDMNENHDEKGRFSVTSSDSGSKSSSGETRHATARAAHDQAKTTSRMYGTSTFHVRDNGKIVAAYHQGVQHSITTGESYGRRVTQSKDPKSSPANKEELRQSILKQQAARVAPDVKSSESPAGALERARASFGPGQFQTSVPYYSTTHIPSGGHIEDIRTRQERARGMTSPHYLAVTKDGSVSHHSSLDDAMLTLHQNYLKSSTRQDYNENHDEKGRFSVSDSTSGGQTFHKTSKEAIDHAKATSVHYKQSTFRVEEHGRGDISHIATIRDGKDVTMGRKTDYKPRAATDRTGTKYGGYNSKQGTKDAGQALRDLQAKGAAGQTQAETYSKALAAGKSEEASRSAAHAVGLKAGMSSMDAERGVTHAIHAHDDALGKGVAPQKGDLVRLKGDTAPDRTYKVITNGSKGTINEGHAIVVTSRGNAGDGTMHRALPHDKLEVVKGATPKAPLTVMDPKTSAPGDPLTEWRAKVSGHPSDRVLAIRGAAKGYNGPKPPKGLSTREKVEWHTKAAAVSRGFGDAAHASWHNSQAAHYTELASKKK